jgi:hypothetical protein
MRGSIIKKPNGRLYIVYYAGKKQKWEKVPENKHGRQTKKDAQRLLTQRINEINTGTYREIKKVTFNEFAEKWFADYVDDTNHLKPSTAQAYRSCRCGRLQVQRLAA